MSRRNLMRRPAPAIPSRGALSARWVRWHDMGWHTLFVGFMLLGVGLLFLSEMAARDDYYDRAGLSLDSHLKKLKALAAKLEKLAAKNADSYYGRAASRSFQAYTESQGQTLTDERER